MASRLIIHMRGSEGDLRWFFEGEERSASTSSAQSLQQKSWDDFSGEVYVFVPTLDIYLTQTKLPQLSATKLQKAIPYAIEDEITQEVKSCHFAFTPIDSAGNIAIAVASQERMNAWLESLPAALKQNLRAMIPDVLCLPWAEGSWTIGEMGDLALVRLDRLAGFAIEKDNVVNFLAQYMRDNNHQVEKIVLVTVAPSSPLEREIVDKLQIPVVLSAQKESWPIVLIKNYDKEHVVDLLQGEYQSNYSGRALPRLRRVFWRMAAAWLIILTGFGLIKLSLLTYQTHKLDGQLATIYDEIFPGESYKVNSKQRIETALAAVKKARQQNVFLRLVAAASPILVNTKGVVVQGAVFSNAQLDVQVEASDFQLLDKVTAELRAKGVIAEQSRATKIGDVTQAHLLLKERM